MTDGASGHEQGDGLTDEEAAILKEFAGNMLTARHLVKWVAYVAGGFAGIAAFIYYILGAYQQVRDLSSHPGPHQ